MEAKFDTNNTSVIQRCIKKTLIKQEHKGININVLGGLLFFVCKKLYCTTYTTLEWKNS